MAPIDNSARMTLTNSRLPLAQAVNDAGRMPGDTKFQGISLFLSRSAAQESALETLIAAQQNPASPQYHQWLNPDQFAARFGAADADLAQVQTWLQSQGFSIDEVSRNRSIVKFSGTAAQVENAFGTEMHYFNVGGAKHFAPSTDLSIPAALAPVVLSINNLTDMLRPKPRVKPAQANFTSGQTGNHYMQPGDVAVVYDINAAYNAGYTGSGETIAVAGQSAVVTQDVVNFQNASGTPVRIPTITLVPGTGVSTVYTGDEEESDLDLEYTGAIAKGASIIFVYTGNASNSGGVFDAADYAVINKIAPIISVSYGLCETALGSYYASYNSIVQQAATQGQTVIAAAGDDGSTDCYAETTAGLSAAQQAALSVDWPGSSQYVTALGGSEFPAADVATTNSTYFTAANGSDVITSAKSYIPEMVWNDDSTTYGLSSGGGGISVDTTRPTWQNGVVGMVTGTYRTVPDISLDASNTDAPYLLCTSDTTSGTTGSCSTGFRNSSGNLTAAGGTSFAAPIFAGMLAIISQKLAIPVTSGLGVINPTLYELAANPISYASAFHDITTGNNACTSAAVYPVSSNPTVDGPPCPASSATSFSAGTGYDDATGLGSVDLYSLMNAWAAQAASVLTTTVVTPATTTPTSGATDAITFKVSGTGTTTNPTGSVNVSVDGAYVTSVALVSGSAAYTYTATGGTHIISGVYTGDGTFAASEGQTSLIVSSPGTFTISASAISVSSGSTATETITITPSGGFTGAVNLAVAANTISNTCYTLTNPTVTGTGAATGTMTIYTNASNCPSGASGLYKGATKSASSRPPGSSLPAGLAMAGLLAVGLMGRRSRRLRGLVVVALLAAAGFGISGCGSSSTAGAGISTNAPTGTTTVTVTATDAATGLKTSTTTFTLTIQ